MASLVRVEDRLHPAAQGADELPIEKLADRHLRQGREDQGRHGDDIDETAQNGAAQLVLQGFRSAAASSPPQGSNWEMKL